MKRVRNSLLVVIALLFLTDFSSVNAAPTTAVLAGGIAINEVLPDPNGANNFDTDGNGAADTLDEFVEIYNTSAGTINIGDFEVWDAGTGNWFTFPAGTMLGAGNYAFVMAGVQAGGSLPALAAGNLAFDAGRTGGAINNGGDNVVLYDPGTDQYVQLVYNGDSADDPTTYSGFSATATGVGSIEDFGSDQDGVSLVREPAGDTAVVRHNTISALNASPGSPSSGAPMIANLVINEIIQNPAAVSDSDGEWFELYNAGSTDVDIDGWTIEDNDFDSHIIANGGPLLVPANGYIVLGRNGDSGTNGGVSVDYVYSGISLANGADEVVILDTGSNEIDRVEYDGGSVFPDPTGASMSLIDPALDNNDGTNWCEASAEFGDGDKGTPGAANDCPVEPPAGDWVINEIHADPDATNGDANGDGTTSTTQDEFVEIFNNSGADVDISNWTISDAVGIRHVFPAGTTVPADCAVIVFAGGSPSGNFGGSVVQTSSTNQLGFNNSGDTVTLNDGTTDVASVGYGSEGGDNQSLTRDPDVTGSMVKHTLATGASGALYSPGTQIDGTAFSGCSTVVTLTLIHDVQGNGAASPLNGQTVTIEGIVVGDFQDGAAGVHGDLNGFFVQEEDSDADMDAKTSEGIFVFDGSSPAVDVAIGDLVRVTGPVSEFNGMTQITSFSGVSHEGSGFSAPTAAVVTLPVASNDDFEAFEGMSVTFPQSLTIVEYFNYDRFGEMVLATDRLFQPTAIHEPGSTAAADLADLNSRSRITLDDGRTAQNPDPAIHPNGDEFTLSNRFRGGDLVTDTTGVLNFSFGLYRIQPTQGADYSAVNLRTLDHEPVGGTLEVATLNVLNYFTTLGSRGADDPEEFTRQRDKIFAALADIDADIVGLVEIENNGTALTDLVAGLNAHIGANTYAELTTGPIGTDQITVAFIYKPATVSTVGGFAVLDDPSFVNPNTPDPKNRPALAQTFIDNSTGGVFTAVVNHLKSKGSGCGAGDDDPEQGSCNLTRTLAAQALVDWLATDPTGSGDADILILGDLNAYDKEDPIDVLVNAGYADLEAIYGGEFAYSFVFSGQFGYLDYAMANAALLDEVTGAATWHINADEPDILDYDTTFKKDAQDALYEANAYRASDHDPIIVGLDVCDEIAPMLGVTMSHDELWPPNHKYVTVTAALDADDNFDQNPMVTLISVTSNEPDNGKADGNTVNDIVIIDDTTFDLRAERSGKGNGRIYTITYEIADACGNSSIATATVTVPKNQGNN